MALIKCNECGEKISKKAETCPHCGNPVKKKGGWTATEWVAIIITVPASIWFFSSLYIGTSVQDSQVSAPQKTTPSPSPAKQSTNWKNQRGNTRFSYTIAQDFVKK